MIELIKRNYRKLLFVAIITYTCYTFFAQQKTINTYKKQQAECRIQIATEQKEQEELLMVKNDAQSLEYIEKIAREKLDMYLPNERVYIDLNR